MENKKTANTPKNHTEKATSVIKPTGEDYDKKYKEDESADTNEGKGNAQSFETFF
jgi:hypothetical protein